MWTEWMCKLSGKMPVGRPIRRWIDNTERDTRDLGFEGAWTERVIYEVEWREMVHEPVMTNKVVS